MKCQILFSGKSKKYFKMSAENCCLALWVQNSTDNIFKYFSYFSKNTKTWGGGFGGVGGGNSITLSSSAEFAQRVIKVKVH